tara:strand:+ start:589 stop:810 length:222 start_codon:yes stop_codon:yes gene_type:complete
MSKKRKYGRKSDTFGAGHRLLAKEGGRVVNLQNITGNSLAEGGHSRGSLSTYQQPKKKSRQQTKAKRRQNRGR